RRATATGYQRHGGTRRIRAQRCVDDVEGGGPARLLLADDDARPEDLDRQPLGVGTYERLRLPLRALVRVVEPLPDVVVVLAEDARRVAGDVRGRDMREAAQAAVHRAQLRQLEQPPRALDVDLARLRQRQRE